MSDKWGLGLILFHVYLIYDITQLLMYDTIRFAYMIQYIDGLVQDQSNSIANALGILQS